MTHSPDPSSARRDPLSVLRATPSDLGDLLPLAREFYAGEKLPYEESTLRRALGQLWEEPLHGAVWLARTDREVVGYGVLCCGFSLEFGGRDAFVDELFVRPDWRGRGVGGAMLAAMESACREAGIRALHLEVDHGNDAGRRLYRRHGFVDHDRMLMTKWLGSGSA